MTCIDLKFDTQILGALLQVIAAGIVALYVQKKSNTERRVATAISLDHEWNTKEMIHSRHKVHESINNNLGMPAISGAGFEEFWMVKMFFMRLAQMRRAGLIDEVLFDGLLARDAGEFAGQVHRAWGDEGITAGDLGQIMPK